MLTDMMPRTATGEEVSEPHAKLHDLCEYAGALPVAELKWYNEWYCDSTARRCNREDTIKAVCSQLPVSKLTKTENNVHDSRKAPVHYRWIHPMQNEIVFSKRRSTAASSSWPMLVRCLVTTPRRKTSCRKGCSWWSRSSSCSRKSDLELGPDDTYGNYGKWSPATDNQPALSDRRLVFHCRRRPNGFGSHAGGADPARSAGC